MKKILIKGKIGWDVMSQDVERSLAIARGDDIEIEIATPGGSVYEGLKIFNAIKNYSGNVTFKLAGLVASMGSYIALARGPENVIAEQNSIYMIHNPSAGAWGDYRIAGQLYDLLNGLSSHLATVYAKATDRTVKEIRQMFDAESYFFGQDIVDQGFASEIIDGEEAALEDDEKTGMIATAKMQVTEVMKKVRALEISEEDIQGMQSLVMKLQGESPSKPQPRGEAAEDKPKPKNEVKIMDLETLKAENRGLYDQIVAEGMKAGTKKERERVSAIMKAGEKLPATARNVVNESIANGDDIGSFQFAAICAMNAGQEIAAGSQEGAQGTQAATSGDDVVEVPDTITSKEDLEAVSNSLAQVAGIVQ